MPMKLRNARLEDAEMLLAWRNDPITRAMSVNSDPIALEGHLEWLSRRLQRETPMLFVAEADGVPCGTVRVDDDVISYTVAPEHRGRGVATEMLRLAHERFGSLIAEIKSDNVGSIRAATKAGHRVRLHD